MHPVRSSLRVALGLVVATSLPAVAADPIPSHPQPVSGAVGVPGVAQRVTFNNQVVRILQRSCQTCHHEGDIAPFPLVTYEDAFDHRDAIRYVVANRVMPPWKAQSDCGDFKGNLSLPDEDLKTIDRWVASGAPEGAPVEMAPALTFSSSWKLGEPDKTLTMAEAFTPDLSKGDVYRCFVLPTSFAEDKYLSAVEILPGNRKMVHHVLLFNDTGGSSEELDRKDPGPGYTCFGGPGFNISSANALTAGIGGWAPGNRPQELPDGVGILLPKGARVVMQIHYSAKSGATGSDVTTLGLHFARSKVQKRYLNLPLANQSFRIPAGASSYEVTASYPFLPVSAHVLSVTPHMHLLGKTSRLEATPVGGSKVCLIKVPDWDFQWQGTYYFTDPIAVPFGSRIDLASTYDNSTANYENPNNPPKDVTWGESTTDEMCIGFLGFTLDSENLSGAPGLPQTDLTTFAPFWERPEIEESEGSVR